MLKEIGDEIDIDILIFLFLVLILNVILLWQVIIEVDIGKIVLPDRLNISGRLVNVLEEIIKVAIWLQYGLGLNLSRVETGQYGLV